MPLSKNCILFEIMQRTKKIKKKIKKIKKMKRLRKRNVLEN